MTIDVFVSYSTKDKIVADSIVATLEANSIRCWYAPRDVKPGSDWGDEIAKAINVSKVFLLIFSENANRSQRVLDELNLAINKEIPIVPFRIEKLDPTGAMSLHLSSRHWLDAFAPSWDKHLDRLVESVVSNLSIDGEVAADRAPSKAAAESPKKSRLWIAGAIVIPLALVLSMVFGIPKLRDQTKEPSQDSPSSVPSPTLTTEPTQTSSPSPTVVETPTLEGSALGSADNPIVWMYIPPNDIDFNASSAAAAGVVSQFTESNPDLSMKIIPASDMVSILNALCDGEAHIGSLGGISFLAAKERGCAEAKFIWSAYSDIKFGGMIVTRADSGIDEIADLEDTSLCIPNYSSTSGWILPSLEIRAAVGDPGSFFGRITEIGDHLSVIEAVDNGECEVGTAYYDARENVEVPGIMDRVTILAATTTMPNRNISFIKGMDPKLAQTLADFLLDVSSDDRFILMSDYTNSPVSIQLIEINDYYYTEIEDLFERADANLEEYLFLER